MNIPATQAILDFEAAESLGAEHNAPVNAKSQAGKILKILIAARGNWVPLPEILNLKISQYSARIAELRALGFHIENRVEAHGKQRHSWFRLLLHVNTTNGRSAGQGEDEQARSRSPGRTLDTPPDTAAGSPSRQNGVSVTQAWPGAGK